jgi:hypothetical protein
MNQIEQRQRKFSIMKQRSHPRGPDPSIQANQENASKMLHMAMQTHVSQMKQNAKHNRELIEAITSLSRQGEEISYEIIQNDTTVAATTGDRAFEEIKHYAAQYSQDGPLEMFKVIRQPVQVL